jgi:5-methylcytosine-specific restriction endonuclease McrA
MICPYCHATLKQHKRGSTSAGTQKYRCQSCKRTYSDKTDPNKKPKEINVINCFFCGEETMNPKFCSSSCAASYNNTKHPKRTRKQHHCNLCGSPLPKKRKLCDKCLFERTDWTLKTVGQVRAEVPFQVNARVRNAARRVYAFSGKPRVCQKCGYGKHIEICHIIGISTFPDETPISEINRPENLVALCPNCHWELDNGLLTVKEIFRDEV